MHKNIYPEQCAWHYASPQEITAYQELRLQDELAYLATHSPFYQRWFHEHGIAYQKITHLTDLEQIPPTSKAHLQAHNNEFLCVPEEHIVDYVTTSGTSGEPVVFALTEGDLNRLAYNEASSFRLAGCKAGERVQIMTTLDRRFMAGLAYCLGARAAHMGMIRVGSGIPELQWDSIHRLRPTVCIAVPSFLTRLLGYARAQGIDPNASSLQKAICIGEALHTKEGTLTPLGEMITQEWPSLALYSTYASTEMQTAFTDCEAHEGGHLPPDLIIAEVLDDHGCPVPPHTPGEVTITTLGVRGMPLLRFRTGDICSYRPEPCSCGRQSMRLSPVIGRKSQMIKLKGTTLYPPALFHILDEVAEVKTYLVEVYRNHLGTDQVQVKIGVDNPNERIIKQLRNTFRARLRVTPNIAFEDIALIENRCKTANVRKEVRFFDLREE